MTDHKATAESLIKDSLVRESSALKQGRTYDGGVVPEIAQVYATLYLAEQQRIANLIAYMALPDESHERESDTWSLINEGLGI